MHKNADYMFDLKNDMSLVDSMIDELDKEPDIDITNIQIKSAPSRKPREGVKLSSGVSVSQADKVGGSRVSRKEKSTSQITSEAKTNKLDQQTLMKKVKETIQNLENEAAKLEETIDFTVPKPSDEYVQAARQFLFNTSIAPSFITNRGISTDAYISTVCDTKYMSTAQPKEGMMDSAPKQLVYISRLAKQLNTQLLQSSDTRLSFNDLDVMICNYFKSNQINDYVAVYKVLQEFFKKLIISSLSDVEQAFRSQNTWVNNDFKKLILKDVPMLKWLPAKLSRSWDIFITELCKTTDSAVFNDVSKLDYIAHVHDDFVIEQTLARTIKCMTPCFIYNYYCVVKVIYLLCGLLDDWFDKIRDVERDYDKLYVQLNNIMKVCTYIYENTRHYENSTARSLPYSVEPISQELQIYYLNHTATGPQYMLLKGLEKYVYGLL